MAINYFDISKKFIDHKKITVEGFLFWPDPAVDKHKFSAVFKINNGKIIDGKINSDIDVPKYMVKELYAIIKKTTPFDLPIW